MNYRKAAVFMNERRAGTLGREPGRYVFEYEPTYFTSPDAPAISLTLPKTQRVHVAPLLFPFFSGLLAEGTNHSIQVRELRVDERDEFALLLATAQRQTIGAVTVRELP